MNKKKLILMLVALVVAGLAIYFYVIKPGTLTGGSDDLVAQNDAAPATNAADEAAYQKIRAIFMRVGSNEANLWPLHYTIDVMSGKTGLPNDLTIFGKTTKAGALVGSLGSAYFGRTDKQDTANQQAWKEIYQAWTEFKTSQLLEF